MYIRIHVCECMCCIYVCVYMYVYFVDLGRVNISGHWRPSWMMSDDDNDGQMIFGDLVGLKLPDICLTGEDKPRKNLTEETCPDRGSNPGPLRDRRACCRLAHSDGLCVYICECMNVGWKGNKCHPFNSHRGQWRGPKNVYTIWSLNLIVFSEKGVLFCLPRTAYIARENAKTFASVGLPYKDVMSFPKKKKNTCSM